MLISKPPKLDKPIKLTYTTIVRSIMSSTDDKDFLKEATLNSQTRRPRPKRTLVPSNVKVSRSPQLVDIIEDALNIIGSELAMYSSKVKKGITLDAKQARIVSTYMDSLVKMSKEARESQKPEQLEHLSDEQLIEIMSRDKSNTDIDIE